MASLIVIFLYLAATTIGAGLLMHRLLTAWGKEGRAAKIPPPDFLAVTGFICQTVFFGIYSLFFRLGGPVPHLLLAGFAIAGFYSMRKEIAQLFTRMTGPVREERVFSVLLFFLLSYTVAFIVAAPEIYDTALYHAQAIQWNEKFPAVPGLGNVHGRLAFNSSFFIMSAVFSLDFLHIQTFFPVNAFFTWILLYRLVSEMKHNMTANPVRYFLAAILLVLLLAGRVLVQSASPHTDFLPLVLICYLFLLYSGGEGEDSMTESRKIFTVTLICVFTVTVKLSALPVVLVAAFMMYRHRASGTGTWLPALLAGLVVLAPWIARNVILSGYFVYPFSAIDLFNPDWKIPAGRVAAEQAAIHAWAVSPREASQKVLQMNLFQWFPVWLCRIPRTFAMLFFFALATPVFLLLPSRFRLHGPLLHFWSVSYAGVIFWLFMAPELRFSYGFLFFASAIPIAMLSGNISSDRIRRLLSRSVLIVLVAGSAVMAVGFIAKSSGTLLKCMVLPEPFENRDVKIGTVVMDGFLLRVPEGDERCFDACIPCSPGANPGLSLRGNTLREGFRIVNEKQTEP